MGQEVMEQGRATSDPSDRAVVRDRVRAEEVDFVLLWFTDIFGQLKSFAITVEELEGALDDGMGFDGSSITGFNPIEESDMVAIPDPKTFQVLPWKTGEHKVARMICDVVTPDGAPYEGDPRYVLRRAIERMRSMGFDAFNVGPELEYFYFKNDEGTDILDHGGYFDLATLDVASEWRKETVKALESMGIPVEYAHHEVAPSQHEIDMRFSDAQSMADHTVTYRLIVKEIATKYGIYATFMPKPLFGQNGSGMHTHQSLFTDGKNAFYDSGDETHLSETGKQFIAGQLKHAREICAIFAQWVNSYKRLVPGYEAPVYVAWSQRNRSALIRIPLYHPGKEQATRAEIRCPDPACNPYLTFAALLHAGLEGIEKGYELPPPMEENLFELTHEERRERGIISLPESLGEAIEELAQSELCERILGPHMFERYVALKEKEWDEYRLQVTPWELERYLSVL
jgi:glutamine synthetase